MSQGALKEGNDTDWSDVGPREVLEFWFPDNGHQDSIETHGRVLGAPHARRRRRGERFAALTEAAACGRLDHWAETPHGRLALILALDQFPRSLWRDTPAAYAQDIKAVRLALEGKQNGHFDALAHPWEKQFYNIAIAHCEGPGHLARMDDVLASVEEIAAQAPDHLRDFYGLGVEHNETVREIIARYGRHPHRNPILGRVSTPDEEAYIATGDFPHVCGLPDDL